MEEYLIDHRDLEAIKRVLEFFLSNKDVIERLYLEVPYYRISNDAYRVYFHTYDEPCIVDDLNEDTVVLSVTLNEDALKILEEILQVFGDFELVQMA